MIIDANNGYVVALKGCEEADPHARFQYYADAERFAMSKSREFRDAHWTLIQKHNGHRFDKVETYYQGKRVKGDVLTD